MSGTLAAFAEVGGRAHNPLTEMMLPKPIDGYVGGERVVWAGDPVGQAQTPAAFRDRRLRVSGQHLRKAARDDLTGLLVIAPKVNVRILEAFVFGAGRAAILN